MRKYEQFDKYIFCMIRDPTIHASTVSVRVFSSDVIKARTFLRTRKATENASNFVTHKSSGFRTPNTCTRFDHECLPGIFYKMYTKNIASGAHYVRISLAHLIRPNFLFR